MSQQEYEKMIEEFRKMKRLLVNNVYYPKVIYFLRIKKIKRLLVNNVYYPKVIYFLRIKKIKNYFKRWLFPIYLFPVKLVTYSIYYLIKFLIKLFVSFFETIWDFISFPFRSLKIFFKSAFIGAILVYIIFSLIVNLDYLNSHYGWYKKYFSCGFNAQKTNEIIKKSVVRIVGGYSEGSGFFIEPNQIVTNFHVIADEPSPKIIFPDGSFITPKEIIGDNNMDLAIIFTEKSYPEMVLGTFDEAVAMKENEPLVATGYALGTELTGEATQLKGNFYTKRKTRYPPYSYIQTSVNLVEGMSGGPLTDQCGRVVGINTAGVGGLSLFIPIGSVLAPYNSFSDADIEKITVDPSASPEEAVRAFYTYLKARKMKEGFNLLSQTYLLFTNFEEWSNRFVDVLDVDVFVSEKQKGSKGTVFIKFGTKNWVGEEVEVHYYEGTWKTVFEDGVYKLSQSNIAEVEDPDYSWFY